MDPRDYNPETVIADVMDFESDLDFYSEHEINHRQDDDSITSAEQGFMLGYLEA